MFTERLFYDFPFKPVVEGNKRFTHTDFLYVKYLNTEKV